MKVTINDIQGNTLLSSEYIRVSFSDTRLAIMLAGSYSKEAKAIHKNKILGVSIETSTGTNLEVVGTMISYNFILSAFGTNNELQVNDNTILIELSE